ncbi:MAG: response regulator [Rhodospirillales bacterium]
MNEPALAPSVAHMICIMVVDDQRAMRAIVRQLLSQQGMENVIEAENGLHAMKIMGLPDAQKPDVIICDLHMDGMDGMEFVHQLRRAKNQTPVLILTGDRNEFLHEVTEQAGASKVLTKPISAPDLASEIHVAIGAR